MTKELVLLKNNQAVTSSRQVAENFGKRHDHTVRDIRSIINDTKGTPNVGETYFFEATYVHSQNKQEYTEYLMNRDGFTLLAMGFTGKEAMKWKIRYIEEFNRMEKALKDRLPSYAIESPVDRAKAWIVEQEEKEELQLQNSQQEKLIGKLKPAAEYTDTILQSNNTFSITQIAKDFEMTGQALNSLLHDLGVQYKQSGQWMLYAHLHGKGLTKSITIPVKKDKSVMHTKWTQKGRRYLHDLLKSKDYLPNIK